MSFVHYRIVLKLLSPLHIGKRKYRNLMETREYVPGRTLWGALTARITRDHFGGNPELYGKVGDFLIENFRFGYLWPSLDAENPYFPWEHDDFDYLLKFGYMGQPIDYDKKATEEGQLHEAEFIGPKTRDGRQVYLIGDLWVNPELPPSDTNKDNLFDKLTLVEKDIILIKQNGKEISICRVFGTIQLGAERNYGWGRVKVESFEKSKDPKALGGIAVENGDEVILKFKKDKHITAHILAADWSYTLNNFSKTLRSMPERDSLSGEIEPLLGYEFRGEWRIPSPPICYVPGSKYVGHKELKLKIGLFGLLEGVKNREEL